MPRKKLYRSTVFPYHVTLRCNNKEWFKLPIQSVWRLTTAEIYRISSLYEARIHAYVLMSNHLHLLLSTPGADLGVLMSEFGGSVTRQFNLISGRSGHLFGGPYQWSVIQSPLYYECAFKYVHRNPVRAGITRKVEDYPFSTLRGALGYCHLPFPIHHPTVNISSTRRFAEGLADALPWLNRPFHLEEQAAIAKGLRRRIFEFPRNPSTGNKVTID